MKVALFAWGVLTGWVLGYDSWALRTGRTTMTQWFHQAKRDRRLGWLLYGVWLGLTWHLLAGDRRVLPEHHHNRYVRYHPLWVAHELLRAGQVVVAAVEAVDNPGD